MQVDFNQLAYDHLAPPPRVFSSDDLEHFVTWCQHSGIVPEGSGGRPFSLRGRPWLEPLYNEKRSNLHSRRVYIKAAQLGLTTRMMYRSLWLTADADMRMNVALMFPTATDVQDLHKTRFRPAMQSSGQMLKLVKDVDAVEVVRIGVSNMRFRGMRSAVSMDSFPADVLEFDEVRLMDRASIERVFLRTSASEIIDSHGRRGIIELNSTAGFPGEDIDYYFQRSTQHTWHAFCESHGAIDVAKTFPDCVDTINMRFICPKCGREIFPEQGRFIQLGSHDAEWDGYSFSQLAKGKAELPTIMQAFDRMVLDGINPSEFYNSFLGIPHQDPDAVLVAPDVFNRAIGKDPDYAAPLEGTDWNPDGYPVAMGIDQRGVEKHVSIWRWGLNGRVYLVHLQTVERSGKQAALEIKDIFHRWHCDIAVCDAYPSYDFATDFARALPKGKVYLAEYHGSQTQQIAWRDETERKAKSSKRSSGEAKYEYLVTINRYLHLLQWLAMWQRDRVCLPTDSAQLQQTRVLHGVKAPVQNVFDMREHFRNIARVNATRLSRNPETGEMMDTGQRVYTFRNIALDPHWVHSSGYAIAGLMRRRGTTQLFGKLDKPAEESYKGFQHQLGDLAPKKLNKKRVKATCATCRFFQSGSDVMGLCTNDKVMLEHGASQHMQTSARMSGCKHHRKVK